MRPVALLVLALAPALALPTAVGHAVPADFRVDVFGGPLPFEGARETLVVFDYRCSGMSTAQSEENMSVAFSVDSAPEWARLSIEPARVDLPACLGVGQVTATLRGSADRNVAGLGEGIALVRAAWSTSGFVLNSTAEVALDVPFVAAFDLFLAESEKTERPQTAVVFPAKVTSRATGIMKIAFEVVEKSENLNVLVPNPVTLQGPDGALRSAEVPLTVQTPYRNGRVDETGTVTYRAIPSAALDPSERGEPQEFTVTVHTKGFYAPGAPVAALLLAVALVGLGLKRRHEKR